MLQQLADKQQALFDATGTSSLLSLGAEVYGIAG